jgi:hypothetical protein
VIHIRTTVKTAVIGLALSAPFLAPAIAAASYGTG